MFSVSTFLRVGKPNLIVPTNFKQLEMKPEKHVGLQLMNLSHDREINIREKLHYMEQNGYFMAPKVILNHFNTF